MTGVQETQTGWGHSWGLFDQRLFIILCFTCAFSHPLCETDKWKCVVHTSDKPDCGTQANVSLVAYGDNGMSEVMTLTNGQEENFLPGKSGDVHVKSSRQVRSKEG